ncbi:hypothetical protein SISSUDRAFT_1120489 [Sistotremastrum suecicum HHB10207 ss-3]|uniref:Uncharacterized protein n=1 Tax=Sistotremastrum suecicum HHB10207 ss-3 TaxID=1314776 RepID=A0A166C6M9_9AGAM|nr:hypothetical protein SISSUDRAFT_1120489 [Sistotremastrum suecicum HHB10207 ss-3]
MEGMPKEVLDEAASALSKVLSASGIRHAMCGGYLAVTLGVEDRETQDIDCIVEGGFRSVIKALSIQKETFTLLPGLTSDVLVALFKSHTGIEVKIELLQSGVFGPIRLTRSNTMTIKGVPFLSPTEYVRTKVKAWVSRRYGRDMWDVLWMLRNTDGLDVDRINPAGGLDDMAKEYRDIRTLWAAMKDADESDFEPEEEDEEEEDDEDDEDDDE